jgi:hypothetical protein
MLAYIVKTVKYNTMRKIFITFFAALSLISCSTEHNPLVKMAKKQMPVTIKDELTEQYNNIKDLKIDSAQLIYDDDSICMMQCIAKANTVKNQPIRKEYRYFYLFDTNQSNLNRKMIFNDGLQEIPCLPTERIKLLLNEDSLNHQSVYNAMYVRTHPIKHPVEKFKR